ncbi:DUF2894 domain-containing protein [Ramlibacter sp. MMS24-I3-19]|uniref:DUF2894 domain-containing protein n=1 Tax=Ramlibacter sp. MMS24-I3-19 TaxID=3416606 RepID=UPI003CFEB8E7
MNDRVAGRDDAEALQAQLAALRADGAWRADPIRFQALEKLSARMAGQPAPVQALLQARLVDALRELSARDAPMPMVAGRRTGKPSASALATLAMPSRSTPELSSVRRFRQAYARLQVVDRVAQALARKPRNAGPLNSHALVLQTFALLQAASPDYLRRMVGVIETMHWLERATETPAAPRKTAKRRS